MAGKGVAVGRRPSLAAGRAGCAWCGHPYPASGGKMTHVRREHSAVWRGLLAQVALPWLYLGVVIALLRAGAPIWTFPVAVAAALAASLRLRARTRSGARPGARLASLLVFLAGVAVAAVLAALGPGR
ncbi:MAG: hypothetical protein HY775_03630 [Acidobacteria bacterium]|nr:hypothetical protein [Acidobacteriota bacterium]